MNNSKFKTRVLDKTEYDLWDDFVLSSPQGSIFHNSKWIETCVENAENRSVKLYGTFRGEELIGGCPIFFGKKYGIFRYGTSNLSLTPYGGFLLPVEKSTKVRENEQIRKEIINSLISNILDEKLVLLSIINSPELKDIRSFTWNRWKTDILYTYIFDLDQNIWDSVSKNVRWTIRKAQKNEIAIEKKFDVDLYWKLNVDTYKKQGLKPPFGKKYISDLIRLLEETDSGEMWIAKMPNGDVASAEILTWDNKMAYRWSAASCNDYKDTGATSFLLYAIFENLKDRGFRKINLMAANTPHLTKFISSFNPELVPYYKISRNRW